MVFTLLGGHTVPCIVSAPDFSGVGGEIRSQFAHITDVMPTLVDLAALTVPSTRAGVKRRPFDGVSIADALRDPTVASKHTEQYFEIWGQRAFYRNGWSATAVHTPGTPFSEDKWELHRVETDPTQVDDLALSRPGLLAELRTAFDNVAWEKNIYPLDERLGLDREPASIPAIPHPLVLRPGYPRVFGVHRLIEHRSFVVETTVNFRDGDQGVIFSFGSQIGGYLLYIRDNAFCLDYNFHGRELLRAETAPLAGGRRHLDLRVHALVDSLLDLRLFVDGQEAARIGPTHMVAMGFELGGVDVGESRLSPVSWEIHEAHGAFRYTGDLVHVRVVPGELAPDRGEDFWRSKRQQAAALNQDWDGT